MDYEPVDFQFDNEGLPFIKVSEKDRTEFNEKENLFAEKLTDENVGIADAMNMLKDYSNLDPLKLGIKEGIRDAGILQKFQVVAKHNVDLLNTNEIRFNNKDFTNIMIDRLYPGEQIAAEDNEDLSANITPRITLKNLNAFGASVLPMFNTVPSVKIVMGMLLKQKKIRKKSQRTVKSKAAKSDLIMPKTMKDFKDVETTEVTTENVSRICGILRDHYTKHAELPLMFYKFVINPESFSQSVENMFYSSFLIKDDFATIENGKDGLPYIFPCGMDLPLARGCLTASSTPSSHDHPDTNDVQMITDDTDSDADAEMYDVNEGGAGEPHGQMPAQSTQDQSTAHKQPEVQACTSLNYKEWKWCINHFNIKKSFIPTMVISNTS